MAEGRDLRQAVGSGDGAWFAHTDGRGRGQLRGADGQPGSPDAAERFTPTVYLYDNYPGGIGLSEPLWRRQAELVQRARELVAACDCAAGCPACVGPVLAADEGKTGNTPRALATRVLELLWTVA
jgi:DEAD/DEAH box helicase domain-containing protein